MPGDVEAPLKTYLLDEYALERSMAKGSDYEHALLEGCPEGMLFATSLVKDNFCEAYPGDVDRLKACVSTANLKREDNLAAAEYADRVENITDPNDELIQQKLMLLAVARRIGAVIVSGENVSLDVALSELANDEPVTCITVEQFFQELSA